MASGSITVTLNVVSGSAGGNYTWQPGPGGDTEFLYASGGYNGHGDTASASISTIPAGAFITNVSVTSSNPCAYFMGQILLSSYNAAKIKNYLNSLGGDYSTTKISAVLPEFKYPLRFWGSTYGIAKPNEQIGSAPKPYSFTKRSNNTIVIYYETSITRPAPVVEVIPTSDGSKFRIEPQGVGIGGQIEQGQVDEPSFECYYNMVPNTMNLAPGACLNYNHVWKNMAIQTGWMAGIDGLQCCYENGFVFVKGTVMGTAANSTIAKVPANTGTVWNTASYIQHIAMSEEGYHVVLFMNGNSLSIDKVCACGSSSVSNSTNLTLHINFCYKASEPENVTAGGFYE